MSQLMGGRWLLVASALAVLCICSVAAKKKHIPLDKCQLPSSNSSSTALVYFEISSPVNSSSCMHYAWSTLSFPTLLVSHTDTMQDGSKCDCSGLHYNETAFEDDQPHGSVDVPGSDGGSVVAVIFTRVVEFNVTRHNAEAFDVFNASAADDPANEEYASQYLNSDNLTWTHFPENSTFRGVDNTTRTANDSLPYAFSITYTVASEVGSSRLSMFPKSQFTEESTAFDIMIENPFYTISYDHSRIALEVLVVHGPRVANGTVNVSRTLDDEYTPSVFKAFTYHFGKDGYFQWKPISYQSQTRKTTKSQQANMAYSSNEFKEEIPPSLASAVFGNNSSELNVTRWFLVIGTSKDQSNLNSNFSTWTAVVGFGAVPYDKISIVIIITIIVGFGVPLVLVVFGGVYVFIKKKPWQNVMRLGTKIRQRQAYSRLN